jgi:hypothetical protein
MDSGRQRRQVVREDGDAASFIEACLSVPLSIRSRCSGLVQRASSAATAWDVRGSGEPSTWFYRIDRFGWSGNVTRFASAESVVHLRYATYPARPWHGLRPLRWARAADALAANLELRICEEARGAVGHMLPIPQDGGDGSDYQSMRFVTNPLATLPSLRSDAALSVLSACGIPPGLAAIAETGRPWSVMSQSSS